MSDPSKPVSFYHYQLKGKSTFTMGSTKDYGTNDESKYYWDYDKKHQIVDIDGRESPLGFTQNIRSWHKNREVWRAAVHNRDGSLKEKDGKRGTEIIKGAMLEKYYKDIRSRRFRDHKSWKKDATGGGTRAYNSEYGAFTFNYEQKLNLKTSFVAKDLLCASFTAGNFCDNVFGGEGVSLIKLTTYRPLYERYSRFRSFVLSLPLKNDELIDHSLIFIVGPMTINAESSGMWPRPTIVAEIASLIGPDWLECRMSTMKPKLRCSV